MRRFQKTWNQIVTEALVREKFTTSGRPSGRPPSLGYFVARCSRRGKAGQVVLEIDGGNRTLRKILPDGRAYTHPNCSAEMAIQVIASAALDADFSN